MHARSLRAAAGALGLGLALAAAARPSRAQDAHPAAASVGGRVTDARTAAPIAGAAVFIEGSALGALADAEGRYLVAGVPAGAHVLVVRRIGYAARRLPVTVAGAPLALDVALEPEASVIAPVVVSATREARRRTESAATIDALDGAEVRLARAAHPAAIMHRVPGVHVSQLSGEGHGTAIRQPISTKPLYLYLEDGVPTRSTGFFNHNALYEVNLPQSGGIEVLKGPGTALYGSDAIGGVVNVLTRPAPVAPAAEIGVEGGAHGYRRLLATGGLTRGTQGMRADLNLTRSDGWRDASGYERQSATMRWDAVRDGGLSFRTVATASRIDQRELAALDSARYAARPETNLSPIAFREVSAVRLSTAIERERGASLLSATPYARYNSLGIMPSWQLSYDPQVWDTRNLSLGVLLKYRRDLAPLRARVILGADADWSPGDVTVDRIAPVKSGPDNAWTSYTTVERAYDYDVTYRQLSPYAHVEWAPVARLRLEAGARFDASAYDYDTHLPARDSTRWRRPASATRSYTRLSPKLGASLDVSRAVNLYASYREGFRAPPQSSLFQQGASANTIDLEPVTAASAEAGVRGEVGRRFAYGITAYDMRVRNDILTLLDSTRTRTTSNAGETRHRGIEASVAAALTSRLKLDASWSAARHEYVDWVAPVGQGQSASNLSFAGRRIEAAPATLANLLLTWRPALLGGGRAAAEWSRTGAYWMDPANTRRYDGFDLVTLHANWMVPRTSAELFGRLTNLTNEHYAELAAFNAGQGYQYTPGAPRSVHAGVRWAWER